MTRFATNLVIRMLACIAVWPVDSAAQTVPAPPIRSSPGRGPDGPHPPGARPARHASDRRRRDTSLPRRAAAELRAARRRHPARRRHRRHTPRIGRQANGGDGHADRHRGGRINLVRRADRWRVHGRGETLRRVGRPLRIASGRAKGGDARRRQTRADAGVVPGGHPAWVPADARRPAVGDREVQGSRGARAERGRAGHGRSLGEIS